MPAVKLSDQFSLDLNATVGQLNLQSLVGLSLADPAVTSLHTGIDFAQPLATGAAELRLNIGLSATLDIFVPHPSGGSLFDPDPYGDDIAVDSAGRYVSIAFAASVGPEISTTVNQFTLGFEAGTTVTVTNYQLFESGPEAPTVLDAVRATVKSFRVPGSLDDLRALPPNSIVTLEGEGTVKVSGSANLLAVANPLATLTLPSPSPSLEVSAGASVTLGASCAITWDYQIRLRKLDARRVTMGFHRKRGSDTALTVDLHGGISAGTTSTDLFSTVIGAVSRSAVASAATLPPDQAAEIQAAVKAAAQRKLEVALLASLTMSASHDAAFLYELDLDVLDAAGVEAMKAALRGDLTGMAEGALPAGVRIVRTIFTELHQAGFTWKLNLLGIYNFISVTELARQGSVMFEPITGDLVITDTATAKRITALTINFGVDTDKLRHVMAESFLITAVYRCSQSLAAAPDLQCSHSFFDRHAATNLPTMRAALSIAEALQLARREDEPGLLGEATDFGPTTVYAETSYDAERATALFLNGENPRSIEEYEMCGREAIQLLIHAGDPDDYRRRPATNQDLWEKMRNAGQANFKPLFPGLNDLQVSVISADYVTIAWWAETMNSCAQRLAAMRKLLAQNPDPQSAAFQKLREDLAQHLADVASKTREEFGRPWGLVAMHRVSTGHAAARVQITGNRLSLACSR